MANTSMSHETVKAVCDKLECSPSQHDASGHHGGKPNIVPTAKSGEATPADSHGRTSEFKMSDRSAKLPNYKKQFADKSEPW
jgi:hypothetical protein